MKLYKTTWGFAFLLWFVGISPNVIPAVCLIITNKKDFLDFATIMATVMGGILVAIIVKKEANIHLKDHVSKLDIKTAALIVALAFFESNAETLLLFKNQIDGFNDKTIEIRSVIFELLLVVVLAPIGEELIFRYGILTVLLLKSNNCFKKILSVLFATSAWMIMHFPTNINRVIQLSIGGIILGYIYLKTKNLLYCWLFHMISNLTLFWFVFTYVMKWTGAISMCVYITGVIITGILVLKQLNLENELVEQI